MKDSIILGSGNSRYLKSVADFKTLYPTYDDFSAALVAGTLPIDLNGINAAGFQQVGDALGKSTLLKDTTAALYELTNEAVPDDVLVLLKTLVSNAKISADEKCKIEVGTYIGAGGYMKTLQFSDTPKIVFVGGPGTNNASGVVALIKDCDGALGGSSGNSPLFKFQNISWAEKQVKWYAYGNQSEYGADISGQKYAYAAIL